MRKRFEVQLCLGQTPIEKVIIPLKSRDELPPILAGLQWLWQHPEAQAQVFALLERKINLGKKATGRPGLTRRQRSAKWTPSCSDKMTHLVWPWN
jgi:hypothetical protein